VQLPRDRGADAARGAGDEDGPILHAIVDHDGKTINEV
jgi:hypothetical protein